MESYNSFIISANMRATSLAASFGWYAVSLIPETTRELGSISRYSLEMQNRSNAEHLVWSQIGR